MKKYIFDTDIGADCDDAVALLYILGKMKDGECEVKAITLCTARKCASTATLALIRDFGYGDIPIGEYKGEPLGCDSIDNYAETIAGGDNFVEEDAVKLMRKTLVENDRVDIICLGPSCNIANLIDSPADEYSEKNGVALIKEKVGKLYIMGGAFEFNEQENPFSEWNIEQDIPSAKKTFEKFPCETVIIPSEVGARVSTTANSIRGLTRKAIEVFFRTVDERNGIKYEENLERTRPSWDPLTCMAAINEEKYNYSERGIVYISENGVTKFKKEKTGKCRYMTLHNDLKRTEKQLNEYLKSLMRGGSKNGEGD